MILSCTAYFRTFGDARKISYKIVSLIHPCLRSFTPKVFAKEKNIGSQGLTKQGGSLSRGIAIPSGSELDNRIYIHPHLCVSSLPSRKEGASALAPMFRLYPIPYTYTLPIFSRLFYFSAVKNFFPGVKVSSLGEISLIPLALNIELCLGSYFTQKCSVSGLKPMPGTLPPNPGATCYPNILVALERKA